MIVEQREQVFISVMVSCTESAFSLLRFIFKKFSHNQVVTAIYSFGYED